SPSPLLEKSVPFIRGHPSPHAPLLAPLQREIQALVTYRAPGAERLRLRGVQLVIGEPEFRVRVVVAERVVAPRLRVRLGDRCVPVPTDVHDQIPLSTWSHRIKVTAGPP